MDASEREMRELADAVRRDLLYREPRDVARERGLDAHPARRWVLLPWHAARSVGGGMRYYKTLDPYDAAYMHAGNTRPVTVDVWQIAVGMDCSRLINHYTFTVS
jgi:hypothetical protein